MTKRALPKTRRKATAKAKARRRARPQPLVRVRPRPHRLGSEVEPEAALPGVDATIWLHRSLPDPTPPSKRLSRAFAQNLRSFARTPASTGPLMLGDDLRHQDERNIALAADSERADRAHYHRAVGLRALVRGLEWAKPRLEARLLHDDRIATYEGGRLDIDLGPSRRAGAGPARVSRRYLR